ncbi:MAG: hypothetical protein IT204_11450 [Fimbriimonadaceae bacterium]|nr:hypothetical protein [Fimbriimonadaceae bacterium]
MTAWLLDGDPAIRWQVLRDLLDQPADAFETERALTAFAGWGARLLALQREDGNFAHAPDARTWQVNLFCMKTLQNLGLPPASAPAQALVERIRQVSWGPEFGDTRFFEGEVEPCINGGVLATGSWFGEANEALVARLLSEQLDDGGWNCEAERGSVRSSFHTTICVLEGLLAYERAVGATPAVSAARTRAHEYLLSRRLYHRLSTGEPINPAWSRFGWPVYWRYDVLRGLDYLRDAGVAPDHRVDEAIGLVLARRGADGRWPLNVVHPEPIHFAMEHGVGEPSRWITLRALRVLRWYRTGR